MRKRATSSEFVYSKPTMCLHCHLVVEPRSGVGKLCATAIPRELCDLDKKSASGVAEFVVGYTLSVRKLRDAKGLAVRERECQAPFGETRLSPTGVTPRVRMSP